MENTRKKARYENCLKSEDDAIQINDNPFNLDNYLTYDILRIIFRYLNSEDLSKAGIICKSWSEAADNERQTRGPCCFVEPINRDERQQAHIFKAIKNLRIKPSLGLYFMSCNPYFGHFINTFTSDFSVKLFYEKCIHVILHTGGTIIDNVEIEGKSPKVVCAFLPEVSNVVIQTFNVTEKLSGRNDYETILRMLHAMPIPNHETSTCLMLFCNNTARKTAISLARALKDSSESKITSLWGGIVRNQYIYNNNDGWCTDNKPYCIGILINGPIRTWSIIVDMGCDTKKQVKAKLKLWKDQIQLRKHSMGFMFVCQARGESMYKKIGVESSIFKKLFPKIPLVGCFGDGEFGRNTISIDEMASENHSDKSYKNAWYNEYSTIFMILTYG